MLECFPFARSAIAAATRRKPRKAWEEVSTKSVAAGEAANYDRRRDKPALLIIHPKLTPRPPNTAQMAHREAARNGLPLSILHARFSKLGAARCQSSRDGWGFRRRRIPRG